MSIFQQSAALDNIEYSSFSSHSTNSSGYGSVNIGGEWGEVSGREADIIVLDTVSVIRGGSKSASSDHFEG